ncbi:MAG: extracellular solute-binding protein [Thermoplasmatales archaeon]
MKRSTLIVAIVIVVVIVAGIGTYFAAFYHPTSSQKITLTVWGSGSAGGESAVFNSTLAEFESLYPNITISDSPAINVASQTFITAAKSGTAPDVYRDTSDNGGVLYASGLIMNLTPYLNSSYINSFTPGTRADWTLNGALYGIPVNTNGIGLYYNKALLPKNSTGAPIPPSNIYQMIQDARNVSAMGSSYLGLPYAVGADYGYRYAAFVPMFNGTLFVQVNSTVWLPVMNSTQNIQTMSFLFNLTKGPNAPDSTSLSTSSGIAPEQAYFETNHAAFILDGPWDQSTYLKYLGSNLGVEAIPYDNATHEWPRPIWGSVGWVISTPAASGITPSQRWAALKFVEFMTNENAQIQYFKQAGDFPSLISAANAIESNASLRASDPLIDGWLQQELHTQIQPNFVQMNYYWSNFHIGASNLWANSTKLGPHPVVTVMNQIQQGILNSLQAAGYPTSAAVNDRPQINQNGQETTQASTVQQNFFMAVDSAIKF